MRRVYIAGPMTGLPEKNYPAFRAMAALLRAQGFTVISPAEIWPLDAVGTWADFMRKDLAAMLTCDVVQLLPGWRKSKGARIERLVARWLGLEVIYP